MSHRLWIVSLSILLVGLLILLLHPFLMSVGGNSSRIPRIVNNGRQIHLSLFDAAITQSYDSQQNVWPVDGQYASSTDFLKAVVSNGWMRGVDYSYFSAPEIPPPGDPTHAENFSADNNAWCIATLPVGTTAGGGSVPSFDAPFLFTKNIGFGTPPGPPWPGATVADMTGLIRGAKPFGDKFGVVVTYKGRTRLLLKRDATQTNFNPEGQTLKVLPP